MNAVESCGIKPPPHSIEAEHSVLGGLLFGGEAAWDRVADVVSESDFYRDDHRRIFRHISLLAGTGKVADVVTVFESIERSNEVDQTGGLGYLGEIANNTPSAANIRRHAEIVRDRAILRQLVSVGDQIANLAHGQGDARIAIDEAQRLLVEIADVGPGRHEPVAIGTVLGSVIEDIEARYNSESSIAGLSTGLVDLDHKLSGLHRGDLIIIAGRASMGKTALAFNIAENVATAGKPALVFSLEMGNKQLGTRAIASLGGVSMERMRSGRLLDSDWDGITTALGRLHDAPLIVDESGGLTVSQMAARARRQMRRQGLALVVIDYLQLMRGEGNTRNEELGDLTRRLKLMAKDLDVPVILLSQISRKVEDRTNKRPLMSDLRESGAIEQDADVILMVYRDEYYHPESADAGTAEVLIVKHRMGATGEVRLAFQGECSRFGDLARDDLARIDHARATAKMQRNRSRGLDD
ncbi:MAG: replicative DNA helicase [Sulfuritalea sp.]|jgi:replicative DNA helicase|nr:replicative DNA helicase [Sulfuritalea sp.]